MFSTPNVEVILKSAPVQADHDKRLVRGVWQVRPFTQKLASEISPDLAFILFHEERPRPGIRHLSWEAPAATRYNVRFCLHPDLISSSGKLENVEIRNLQIVRSPKIIRGRYEYRLLFEARFPVLDKVAAAKLVFDCSGQTMFLTFEARQQKLKFESQAAADGAFVNQRAVERQAGLGLTTANRGEG